MRDSVVKYLSRVWGTPTPFQRALFILFLAVYNLIFFLFLAVYNLIFFLFLAVYNLIFIVFLAVS